MRKLPPRETGHGISPTFPIQDVGAVISGTPRSSPVVPEVPSPCARPGLAKLSLQPRGWPANLAIVRRQNPENSSGSHQHPGSRRGTRCADPGVSLPPEAGRPRSSNAETGRVQRSEDQTLSPTGLTRTPPPARPKVSGRRSPSVRPRRSRRTMGTTMSTMQCTNAGGTGSKGALRSEVVPSPEGHERPALLARGSGGS